jgi:hypothetical protein
MNERKHTSPIRWRKTHQWCYSNKSEEGLARNITIKVSQRKIRTSKKACAGQTRWREEERGRKEGGREAPKAWSCSPMTSLMEGVAERVGGEASRIFPMWLWFDAGFEFCFCHLRFILIKYFMYWILLIKGESEPTCEKKY